MDARNVLDLPGGRRLVGAHADRTRLGRDARPPVTRARGALALVTVLAACSAGRDTRLRIAVTESGGEFMLSLEEPVRAVTCVERDYRRSPTDPAATRPVWTARCTDGASCRTAIRYGDRALETSGPTEPLAPSAPGACYECDLTGDHGRGLVRFRVADGGGFEACRPRVGDL